MMTQLSLIPQGLMIKLPQVICMFSFSLQVAKATVRILNRFVIWDLEQHGRQMSSPPWAVRGIFVSLERDEQNSDDGWEELRQVQKKWLHNIRAPMCKALESPKQLAIILQQLRPPSTLCLVR